MSIAELGSLGEFFASIGVLITLIFLVIQTRQNTDATRRTNERLGVEHNSRALAELIDSDVAEIFLKGQKSLASLSEVERYRFDLAFTMWLQSVEQAFADYRSGMFSEDQIIAYKNSVPAFLNTPGGEEWWKERQVWFSRPFRKDVEVLCAKPSADAAKAGPPQASLTGV